MINKRIWDYIDSIDNPYNSETGFMGLEETTQAILDSGIDEKLKI